MFTEVLLHMLLHVGGIGAYNPKVPPLCTHVIFVVILCATPAMVVFLANPKTRNVILEN